MPPVVVVHGVGQQLGGPETYLAMVGPALKDGVHLAGGPKLGFSDVACAFYGDVFRPPGTRGQIPAFDAHDIDAGFETELLLALWEEAARRDNQVVGPDARTKGAGYILTRPLALPAIQRALDALSNARFFAGVTERLLVFSLKQVRLYFEDYEIRKRVIKRVVDEIGDDTRVVVGHSLGSVVAYEALCSRTDWLPKAFVTLGSPLGLRNLIFDRLTPSPREGVGCWPAAASTWSNIADVTDVVAAVGNLARRFGDRVSDYRVANGARMHDITAYLTAAETGASIAAGLADR